ncbi:nucleotidyltransferase domain-containing protein [Rhizobacter sp. J219]|uniref:nucleotidyltransferase domain-containing protein n=1 Tax=Rhizobacter sp. J219 TaxID=2898430 RepID=UPI0021513F88|nr:nucleotidyltransferase domain-containing protein [Rhizobacter sp. J219]MCR5883477.1 nucleotidyltransferase domain-containing protein [Rhizobacter sp. J219]
MKKFKKNAVMHYLPLPENAVRQGIDSTTVFTEFRRVQAQARPYAGSMYWKREGAYEYLVKTRPRRRTQERLGARSDQTEQVFADYHSRKLALESRLASLQEALTEAERMNKALKAGRTPNLVVAVLQALEDAGLSDHFTVVGTHALYAYETAAGVRIVQGALATQDVDLLWDARKRVQFMSDLQHLDASVLSVLKRADRSFERKEGQNETAINARGFEVDFLRRQPVDGDPHPFRFSDDEGDLWPVQAIRASVLTTAPRFEHPVIAVNGRMAMMRTISPQVFVEFKRWMGERAPQREEVKRRRDRLQADIVQELLEQKLLVV